MNELHWIAIAILVLALVLMLGLRSICGHLDALTNATYSLRAGEH